MANEILYKVKDAQIVFRDVTDFSPTAANDLRIGSPTAAQLNLEGLVNNAARQSAKVDLGATRARAYSVMACIEFATAPTTGALVKFYWAPSPNATAATANPGGASGSDAAYDGGNLTLDEGLAQLDFIGAMVCGATGTAVQIALINPFFSPSDRYGSLVVDNDCGQTLFATDAAEFHVVFTPVVDEVQ